MISKAVIFLMTLAIAGCTESDFASSSANEKDRQKNRPAADAKDGDSDSDDGDSDAGNSGDSDAGNSGDSDAGGKDASDNDGTDADEDIGMVDGPDSGIEIDESQTTHAPKPCITENVKFSPGDGASCPANYAAYTADDGSAPHLGCCPLPARDILSKDPAQTRGTTCLSDEIATGVSGGSIMCTRINTKRYKLSPIRTSCYAGSGASGGSGTGACGVPNATFQALISKFGSDACIGQPYGALITSRTGKNCGDVKGAQLLYVDDGLPVKMYE